jgi:hypothetical protein
VEHGVAMEHRVGLGTVVQEWGGSGASASAVRPRTSRCCGSCAWSAGSGWTRRSSRTPPSWPSSAPGGSAAGWARWPAGWPSSCPGWPASLRCPRCSWRARRRSG